ncbi:hypothetical protein KIN20_032592, partial [Parelaphostrongylus tenuis]
AAQVLLGCDCARPFINPSLREYMDLSIADDRNEFAVYPVASVSSTHIHKAAALLSGNWTATNQIVSIKADIGFFIPKLCK